MPIAWVTTNEGYTHAFNVDRDGYVEVWIYGACYGTIAGVGVWFGENHPLNISTPVEGCATNNMVEIQAAMWAVQQGIKAGVQNIRVLTNSEFTIKCVTKKTKKWKKIGWGGVQTGKYRKGVINADQLKALDEVVNHPGVNVKWERVKSHSGHFGLQGAISLAKRGAEVHRIPAGNIIWQQHGLQWRGYGLVFQTTVLHQPRQKVQLS